MTDALTAAERFIRTEARLLEQRLFDSLFHGAPATGVADAVRAYRNPDGGFGHGMEPDKRCPASLPVDVEIALDALATANATAPDLVGPACDYLTGVAADADAGGAVPLAFPVIEGYPRAEHWSDWTYAPGLNPTAGLAAALHRLAFSHPWRDAATAYCWRALDDGPLPDEVHALAEVVRFLDAVPERERAVGHAKAVVAHLAGQQMYLLDPDAPGYGLTPLDMAPEPGSIARPMYGDDVIGAHLDKLAANQQTDGGWPITWDPPGDASRLEWRGIVTLRAVRTLHAYGRTG